MAIDTKLQRLFPVPELPARLVRDLKDRHRVMFGWVHIAKRQGTKNCAEYETACRQTDRFLALVDTMIYRGEYNPLDHTRRKPKEKA